LPLLEISQAVSVVPRALLDDQNARKLDDALQNRVYSDLWIV
jgi:outer membrane receptor for monomeric catechols